MSQPKSQSLEAGKNVWKEHRGRIIFGLALILTLVVVFCPLVPDQYAIAGTRTLQYDSSFAEDMIAGSTFSTYSIHLSVINKDVIDGNFSVTFRFWSKTSQPYQLVASSSETGFIRAGASQVFDVPDSWMQNGQYSFTRDSSFNDACLINYSVVTPSVPYYSTHTEWKSIFTLAFGS
jgi:hypothetical protein